MNFKLAYSGSPGSVSATLTDDKGKTLSTTSGLKDERAARKWASTEAKQIKEAAAIEASREHQVYVSISGHDHFSL